MEYQTGLCDLVRAIDLTLIALVEPEVTRVQVALETRRE
jgi:hypothetical protein